jgi:hypothetical protein
MIFRPDDSRDQGIKNDQVFAQGAGAGSQETGKRSPFHLATVVLPRSWT